MVIATVSGLVLITGGGIAIWAAGRNPAVAPSAQSTPISTASPPLADEMLETIKALKRTQQETIDQLQIVQDQLAAQKLEIRKLTDQIADMTEKLDTLQTSVSNMPASSSTSAVLASKSHH
jgi:septal ring factor EnvC (AmiA/AmiB activator)